MELAIGTGGLKNKFSKEYWDIFTNAIDKGSFIHTALNYENVEQYFLKAHSEGIKISKTIIKIDPGYFRPTEIDELRGDSKKARRELNWKPKTTFQSMVKEMVLEDIKKQSLLSI